MTGFDLAVDATFAAEGGAAMTDHQADRGGATRWGITERLARVHGYEGPMSELPRMTAKEIARAEFWAPLQLDELRSDPIAAEVFDTAFHSGRKAATEILQRSVNLMYADSQEPLLAVDGVLGPNTLNATNSLIPKYERHLFAALQGYQFVRFVELIRVRPMSSRPFIRGWMLRLGSFPNGE